MRVYRDEGGGGEGYPPRSRRDRYLASEMVIWVDIECNHRYVGVIDETEVVGGRTRSRKVVPRGWVIGEGLL